MASFPPRLLAALDRLPETGQYLLVISNLPNLTETEQAKLKELALRKDERLASAVKVFKMNKDSTSLTSTLKGILSSPQPRSAQRATNTQADPVFEAFKAMDVDNTGFISFDNLLTVLQQLFKNLGQAAADANMSPDELAYATANESFLVADSNRNGRINYHEFREWYKTDNYKKLQGMKRMVSGGRQTSGPTAALSGPTSDLIQDLRSKYEKGGHVGRAVKKATKKLTSKTNKLCELRNAAGLNKTKPKALATAAKALLKQKETVTEEDFIEMLQGICKPAAGFERERHNRALREIFKLCDADNSGTIDPEEMLNSVVLLSGGSEDAKIEAVFELYDLDGNGLITMDELVKHQKAVFQVAFANNPELRQKLGETPQTLALATAESIFKQIDTNKDNVITLDEFMIWYRKEEFTEESKEDKKRRLDAMERAKKAREAEINRTRETISNTQSIENLNHFKDDIGLAGVHVQDALGVFKARNVSGFFSRRQFKDSLEEIVNNFGDKKQQNLDVFDDMAAQLYLLFDNNGDGVVDMNELFGGLSLLFSGNIADKLLIAFNLYDESGDQFLQFNELLKFLQSYFTVTLFNSGSKIKTEDLARATARKIFTSSNEDFETGKLSFDQFRDWVGNRI